MSLKEKKLITYIAGSITFFTLYSLVIYRAYITISPTPEGLLTFWAPLILIMIPVQALPKMFIDIIFKGIHKSSTDKNIAPVDKETERVIELKMLKMGYMFFVAGFLLAMFPPLFGGSLSLMFTLLLLSMAGSCIFTDLSGLLFYREAKKRDFPLTKLSKSRKV